MAYGYDPSMAAGVIFFILFAAETILHCFQLVRTRTWFLIPLCIGALMETIGYLARCLSAGSSDPNASTGAAQSYYIMQTVLILVSPALVAASIYMSLGRVAQLADAESYLLVRRNWLTRIFVTGDIISFLMQAGGGGMMSSDDKDSAKTGKTIVVGGLFVQIIFFGCFVITSAVFNIKLHKVPTTKVAAENPPFQRHLTALYIASALIFFRSIVRVVEFIQGFSGYIATHEVFIYIFDGIPMVTVLLILSWIHASEINSLLKGGKMVTKFLMLEYRQISSQDV